MSKWKKNTFLSMSTNKIQRIGLENHYLYTLLYIVNKNLLYRDFYTIFCNNLYGKRI